jgi:hypothetical protein
MRKCKADKKRADIFVRITVNGEIKELSIKQQIDAANWDNRKNWCNFITLYRD